jgi:hypothetical protein
MVKIVAVIVVVIGTEFESGLATLKTVAEA